MKRLILLFAIAACVDSPYDMAVDATEQAICNSDPDTCPGNHPITLRAQTKIEANTYCQQNAIPHSGDWSVNCWKSAEGTEHCNVHVDFGDSICVDINCTEDSAGNIDCYTDVR
jgi:invasion protein IalB